VALSHTPVSLVVVWADGPAFVHVTRVPTLIVMVDGENVKFWIVTQAPEQLGDVELLQASETAKTPPSTRRVNHIGPPCYGVRRKRDAAKP